MTIPQPGLALAWASARECLPRVEYPTPNADPVVVWLGTGIKLVIAATVIIGIVGSGCGDRSSASETMKSGQVFSAPAFIQEFEKQTGHKLFDLSSPAIPGLPRVHRLDVINLHAPKDQPNPAKEELKRRFGQFSIFLYESAGNAREALRGTAPDAQGIYWTHSAVERGPHAGESQWIAEKLYPENVITVWWGPGQRLDERWRRLDELLGKITGVAAP